MLFTIIKAFCFHVCLVNLFAVIQCANSIDFYREKPFFVQTCKFADANFDHCFARSIQAAFQQICIGIPGVLESRGPLEPLLVDKMSFNDTNDLLSLEGDFTSVSIAGLSHMNFTDYRISPKTLRSSTRISIPSVRFEATYRINGKVLSLPFNATGEMYFLGENLDLHVRSVHHLYKKDGFIFLNATDLRLTIDAEKMCTHYDNIFPDAEVNELFNQLINDNWRKLFETVRPLWLNILNPLYLDLYQTIFDLIPMTFFIEDLPTSGSLYINNHDELKLT